MSEKNLIEAIRFAPDDDATWLVYADWLEENGEASHAEYVRVSVARAAIADETDVRRGALFEREQELERLHGHTWRARLAAYLPKRLRGWISSGLSFTRGLPGWLDADVSRFAPDAEGLASVFPITSASLRIQSQEDVDALTALPALRHFQRLTLFASPAFGPAIARFLVTSEHLSQLSALQLFGLDLGDEGLTALARAADRFTRLEMLELSHTEVTAAGVVALANSPLMRHLKDLWLRGNAVGPDGLRALASANAPALEQLWLQNTQLGDVGNVLASARWPSLWRLNLDDSGLAAASLSALLRAAWFSRLRDLSLRGLSFSPRRSRAASRPRRTELRSFNVGSPALTDAGLTQMLNAYQFPELRSFWCSETQIGDESIFALTAHPCEHLGTLYLMNNRIGTAGALRLLTSPNLPALRGLTICRNHIGREPVADVPPPTAPRLVELDLSYNPMTSDVARVFLARPELALLRKLRFKYSPIGPDGGRWLADAAMGEALKELFLCGTALQDRGVIDFLEAPYLKAVRDLSFQSVSLTDDAVAALSAFTGFDSLLSLRLDKNEIGPAAAASLVASPWLERLTALHLSDSRLGDEGVAALVASPAVSRLYVLGINNVGLTDAGVRSLLDSKHLSRSLRLHVAGNDEEIEERFGPALTKRFGEVDFRRHPHVDMAW